MSTPAKLTLGVCLAVAIFYAGYVANRQPAPAASSASTKQVLYYACPMHPQYRSDHPGDAPCCGMRLEPVYAGGQPGPAGAALPPGAVEVSTGKRQLIGVRTDEVTHAPSSHVLRLPGRISVDETRLYRIIAASAGWIRELGPATAGSFVKRDQILASYYVREFLAAQQTLFYTFSNGDVVQRGEVLAAENRAPVNLNMQRAVDSLRSLGMSDSQIEEVQKTRKYASAIHIFCPITGFVLARGISPDQRFEQGTELYRIADISHVWVMADVFEKDREFLKPGATATVRYHGREFPVRMSDVLPQFDPQSRTLKARFELDNPGYVLRPDEFVDVEVRVNLPDALTAPADAVIDSGRRKTVFVERGEGVFEPRLVETGWRFGDRVEIRNGLQGGERVVVSGGFLLDSESRMKLTAVQAAPAAAGSATAKDPVCGMDVDTKAAKAIKAEHGGKTWYFCSDHCKKTFEAKPGQYAPAMLPLRAAASPMAGEAGVERDPVCGMDVDPKAPKAIKTEYDGKTWYFCSDHCKKTFEANPGKYAPAKPSPRGKA